MGKYNEKVNISTGNYHQSAIWKYLNKDIDEFLSPELDDKLQKSAYVSNPGVEEMLSSLLKYSTEHRYYMLSGLTGIGKTTIMRHVFFNDKTVNTPIIKNRNLIIPIDFDTFIEPVNNKGYLNAYEDLYIKIFAHAAELLKNQFNLPSISDKEFVDFFDKLHSGIINYIDKDGNRNTFSEMKKEMYNNTNTRIYAVIAELCIFLNHNNSNIKNVIIIVDNIESLGIYKTPIQIPLLVAHKAVNFMCKKSVCHKNGKSKWVPNILICCRHYIYRMMHTRDFEDGSLSQIFESFSEPIYIDLDSPAPLKEIIYKRYYAYQKHNKLKDKKRKDALDVVCEMLIKIIDETTLYNHNNILADLNLSDIRSMLKTLKDIVYNKTWIQRDDFEDEGSFNINSLFDFNCRLSNILRAIGMKSGYIYFSGENLIPNLLANKPNNRVNIYDLLALQYFMHIASSWRTPISIYDFHDSINTIFKNDNNTIKCFNSAIWHLLKSRMLLRCSDQEQRDISSITFQNYNEITNVFVSNAAKDYWSLFGINSVILEMLMDDIYLDEKELKFSTERQTKYKLFNKDSFLIALTYLSKIFESEKALIQKALNNNKGNEFFEAFGKDLITEHLLIGLQKSYYKYFRGARNDEKSYLMNCSKLIVTLSQEIANFKNEL